MNQESQFLEKCHAYFDGRMAPGETEVFLAQLDGDAAAYRVFMQMQKQYEALKRYAQVDPPAYLESQIRQAVALAGNEPLRLGERMNFRRFIALQAAAALMLIAGIGLVFQFQPWQLAGNTQSPVATVQPHSGESPIEVSEAGGHKNPVVTARSHTPPLETPSAGEVPAAEDAQLEADLTNTWQDVSELNEQMVAMETETRWISPEVVMSSR